METLRMISHYLPRSILGGVLAIGYAVFATVVVYQERRSVGGDWISLKGMGAYLITLPVSLPAEQLGHRLDFRRNLDMLFAIGACAVGIYLVGAGLGWVVSLIVSKAHAW